MVECFKNQRPSAFASDTTPCTTPTNFTSAGRICPGNWKSPDDVPLFPLQIDDFHRFSLAILEYTRNHSHLLPVFFPLSCFTPQKTSKASNLFFLLHPKWPGAPMTFAVPMGWEMSSGPRIPVECTSSVWPERVCLPESLLAPCHDVPAWLVAVSCQQPGRRWVKQRQLPWLPQKPTTAMQYAKSAKVSSRSKLGHNCTSIPMAAAQLQVPLREWERTPRPLSRWLLTFLWLRRTAWGHSENWWRRLAPAPWSPQPMASFSTGRPSSRLYSSASCGPPSSERSAVGWRRALRPQSPGLRRALQSKRHLDCWRHVEVHVLGHNPGLPWNLQHFLTQLAASQPHAHQGRWIHPTSRTSSFHQGSPVAIVAIVGKESQEDRQRLPAPFSLGKSIGKQAQINKESWSFIVFLRGEQKLVN